MYLLLLTLACEIVHVYFLFVANHLVVWTCGLIICFLSPALRLRAILATLQHALLKFESRRFLLGHLDIFLYYLLLNIFQILSLQCLIRHRAYVFVLEIEIAGASLELILQDISLIILLKHHTLNFCKLILSYSLFLFMDQLGRIARHLANDRQMLLVRVLERQLSLFFDWDQGLLHAGGIDRLAISHFLSLQLFCFQSFDCLLSKLGVLHS